MRQFVAGVCVAGWLGMAGHCLSETHSSHHFLWRVRNAPAPFYLLGSLHAMRGPDYPLPPVIDQVLEQAQRVIFETNPDSADAPLLRHKLRVAGQYPAGQTIERKLTPQTFARVREMANTRLSFYDDQRPWAIALFQLYTPATRAFDPRRSVDRYVYDRVRGRKQIAGLETVDEFVHSLARMDDRESELFLLDCIGFAERAHRILEDTTAAWNAGNVGQMQRIYWRGPNSAYWRWVRGRNHAWAPRIATAINSGKPTLVVAGALHFCERESLIDLLQARGYQLEQL